MMRSGKLRWKVSAILVLVLFVGAIAACGSSGGEADTVGQTLDAQALLEERCTQCHDVARATSLNQDRSAWQATVEDMIRRGATLNDQEKDVLVDYLAEEYGPQ